MRYLFLPYLFFHPPGARVRRLLMHPREQSWIVSGLQGNNEVSMWDVETGARQKALWASSAPPLSQTQVSAEQSDIDIVKMIDFMDIILCKVIDVSDIGRYSIIIVRSQCLRCRPLRDAPDLLQLINDPSRGLFYMLRAHFATGSISDFTYHD